MKIRLRKATEQEKQNPWMTKVLIAQTSYQSEPNYAVLEFSNSDDENSWELVPVITPGQ